MSWLNTLVTATSKNSSGQITQGGGNPILNLNVGVNASGMEFADPTFNWDIPTTKIAAQRMQSIGFGLIRLPFRWERVQPVLNGVLDTVVVNILKAEVSYYASLGMKVLLDVHNFGQRNSTPFYTVTSVTGIINANESFTIYADAISTTPLISGRVGGVSGGSIFVGNFQFGTIPTSGVMKTANGYMATITNYTAPTGLVFDNTNLTKAHFNNLWLRLAQEFVGATGLAGYDIMNEPVGIPGATSAIQGDIWKDYAQECINTIRTVDTFTPIYVEGYFYASASQWTQFNPNIHLLTDPSNNIVFSAHCYLDRDNSGTHFDWDVEVANGSYTNIGVDRISVFKNWMTSHGLTKGHIGELGSGESDGWQGALEATLNYISASNLQVTGWSAGGVWGNYGYLLEPDTVQFKLRDKKQIAVYRKAFNKAGSTLFDSGSDFSSTGTVNTITVYNRGYTASPIVVNMAVTGGATLSTTSITIPAGLNQQATYTIQATSGSSTVTYSRPDGGDVPIARGFTIATSPIETASKMGIWSLVKEVGSYTGAAVRLKKMTSNIEADFNFTSLNRGSWVDYAAIATWAGSEEIRVKTVYDQSGLAKNLSTVFSTDSGVATPSDADMPKLILNTVNGKPVMRWNTSRMEAAIAVANKTEVTLIAHVLPRNNERLFGWDFTDYYTLTVNELVVNYANSGPNEPTGSIATGATLNTWQTIATTHKGSGDGSGKRKTYNNGNLVNTVSNYIGNIHMQYNKPESVTVGWFRWWNASRLDADIVRLMVFDQELSAADIGVINSDIQANF